MVNTKNAVSVVDVVKAMATLKQIVASSQDGAVVGVDSVSGDDYFQTMPSVGTIYIGANGKHRIIVDALAYPAHKSTSGTSFAKENRFISVAFDKDTLLVIAGSRVNTGYDAIAGYKVLSIDPFTFIAKAQADAKAKADLLLKAKKALDTKVVANARQSAMSIFTA